jgi:hypothetical protein
MLGSIPRGLRVSLLTVAGALALMVLAGASSGGTTYIDGDWDIIGDDTTLADGTWYVNGTLRLFHCELILDNATLVLDDEDLGNLVVRVGSRLVSINSTIRGEGNGVHILVMEDAFFDNTTLYDPFHRSWASGIDHENGVLELRNCVLGYGETLIRSYSTLIVRDCEFLLYGTAISSTYDEHRGFVPNVLVEDSIFRGRPDLGRGLYAIGPAEMDVPCSLVVRNSRFHNGSHPIFIRDYMDNGVALFEGLEATNYSEGPRFDNVGSALTIHHNSWNSPLLERLDTPYRVIVVGDGAPTIHNETIVGGFIGMTLGGLHGVDSPQIDLWDMRVEADVTAFNFFHVILDVHRSTVRGGLYDFVVSESPYIRLLDCDHSYKGRIDSESGLLEEISVIQVSSITWYEGPSFVPENLAFVNDSGEELRVVEGGVPTRIELPTWRLTYNKEYLCERAYGRYMDGNETFETEPFVIRDPGGKELVFFDDFVPSIVVDKPEPREVIRGEEILVWGTFLEKGSGLGSIFVRVDEGEWLEASDVDGANWTIVIPILEDGVHNLSVQIIDRVGNTKVVTVDDVSTDSTCPSITVLRPSGLVNRTPVIFTFQTEAGASASVNGRSVKLNALGVGVIEVALSEGPNWIAIRVVDQLDNENYLSYPVELDTIPPEILVERPVEGEWIPSSLFEVAGRTEETAVVWIDGSKVDREEEDFWLLMERSDGEVEIQITASDLAGNHAMIELVVFVDTTPPWLLLDELPKNGMTTERSIVLIGNVNDLGPTRVLVNGWTVDVVGTRFQFELALVEGWNDVYLEVVDVAGNSRFQSFQVLCDSIRPELDIELRVGDARALPGAGRLLTSMLDGNLTLDLSEDCTVFVTGVETKWLEEGSHKLNVPFQPNRLNTIVVSAMDSAGNAAVRATFEVLTDNLPPALIIFRPGTGSVSDTPTILIEGQVEAGCQVYIKDEAIGPDTNGLFRANWDLVEGKNVIMVSASDRAGNQATAWVEVTYEAGLSFPFWYFGILGGVVVTALWYGYIKWSRGLKPILWWKGGR